MLNSPLCAKESSGRIVPIIVPMQIRFGKMADRRKVFQIGGNHEIANRVPAAYRCPARIECLVPGESRFAGTGEFGFKRIQEMTMPGHFE